MIQVTKTSHMLEIAGPRGQIWRPAAQFHERFRPAQALAEQGNLMSAIQSSEDLWIATYGDMHGVTFRVKTASETLTGLSSVESVMDEPK